MVNLYGLSLFCWCTVPKVFNGSNGSNGFKVFNGSNGFTIYDFTT